uniref:ZSWIM1/3 RNaseH-like domain-containing protein n=1 Tax=Cacopsylla melanoneura TaxID=428564 RepID=A0A8D8QX49_9HEMI
MKAGVSMTEILNRTKKNASSSNRAHLINRKQLENIKKEFNLYYPTWRHANDATSVKLWVEDLENQAPDSPVLLYKEQGVPSDLGLQAEDFVLVIMSDYQKDMIKEFGSQRICIDGTHGLNSSEFTLHSLVVIDERATGIPVGHMFSNRCDTLTLSVFLDAIKQACGGPIATEVLFSFLFAILG